MFQTAFPFGYLIQFVLFVGGVIVAAMMMASGWSANNRVRFRAGLVLAGIIAAMIGLAMAQPRPDDWGPRAPREVLFGRWVDGPARSLELRADSTYTLHEGVEVTEGRYDWDMGNVWLRDPSGRPLPMPPLVRALRLVVADGEYRIINDPWDPDVWDGWMGYRHDPPARVPKTAGSTPAVTPPPPAAPAPPAAGTHGGG